MIKLLQIVLLMCNMLFQRDMCEIQEKGNSILMNPRNRQDSYLERTDSGLPVPGTRVRRGPDWRYQDKQDQFTAGTVTGHAEHGLY